MSAPLAPAALDRFAREGWLSFPGFLDADLNQRLIHDTDRWADEDASPPIAKDSSGQRIQLSLPAAGELVAHPPLMAIVEQLLGPGFHYHHLHLTRQPPGHPHVHWHQDYEQMPQLERSHRMVHAFFYPRGLDGTVGDLLLLPRSHELIVENNALGSLFGSERLPGEVVIDDLPPGSLVLIHSALNHGRRAKPGGTAPRYLIDVSYCQAGIRWPSNYGRWREKLALARARGLDRGRWPSLFDERAFFDADAARQRIADARGSLIDR